MSGLTTYLQKKLLDYVLRNTAYTAPTTVYISLHTADPGDTGASEVAGGSYARQAGVFAAAASVGTKSTSSTSAATVFAGMPACTVVGVGIWDALSSGNLLFGGVLATPRTFTAGQTCTIDAADLDAILGDCP